MSLFTRILGHGVTGNPCRVRIAGKSIEYPVRPAGIQTKFVLPQTREEFLQKCSDVFSYSPKKPQ